MEPNSFEEMDKDFEKRFRPFRDQKIARGELEGFEPAVMRKIQVSSAHSPGAPVFGIAAAVCLSFALIGAGIGWFHLLPSGAARKTPVQPVQVLAAEPVREAELMTEIEALKELGIWDEEDDKGIGITLENTLSELDLESNFDIPVITEIKPVR